MYFGMPQRISDSLKYFVLSISKYFTNYPKNEDGPAPPGSVADIHFCVSWRIAADHAF
jgi:hypothetical protein